MGPDDERAIRQVAIGICEENKIVKLKGNNLQFQTI